MLGSRLVVVAMLATTLGSVSATAQSLRDISGPKEVPPASFTASQYVDSKGCVFIRAGYGGVVTWVPRVTADRKVVCGQTPSLSSGTKVAAAAPAAKVVAPAAPAPAASAPKVVAPKPAAAQAVAAQPAPKPVVAKPAPVVVAAPKPARVGAPIDTVASIKTPPKIRGASPAPVTPTVRYAPAPVKPAPVAAAPVVVAAAPVPVEAAPSGRTTVRIVSSVTACPNYSPMSQRYVLNDGRHVVRCGPQSDHPATYVVVGRSAGTVPSGAGTVAAPVIVAAPALVAAPAAVPVPKGYKLAWEDGRLSTTRAVGTAQGQAAMDLVWTAKTPRRLYDRRTGRNVTVDYAGLVYPYTDYVTQRQALGTVKVAAKPVVAKPVVVASAAKPVVVVAAAKVQGSTARVSTKSSATEPAPSAGPSHRFVQVGTFGVPDNAAAAAARLQALGLPVHVSKITKGGKPLQIVLAGPFASQQQLSAALSASRRSGFGDAFARN